MILFGSFFSFDFFFNPIPAFQTTLIPPYPKRETIYKDFYTVRTHIHTKVRRLLEGKQERPKNKKDTESEMEYCTRHSGDLNLVFAVLFFFFFSREYGFLRLCSVVFRLVIQINKPRKGFEVGVGDYMRREYVYEVCGGRGFTFWGGAGFLFLTGVFCLCIKQQKKKD
ncbi:hypothetical protein F5X99DRAFT_178196 [Biscogniauxia marginata]|nr:hypothetical protein F5X99DRAFT_178196 [Biscogniauxia marginata]